MSRPTSASPGQSGVNVGRLTHLTTAQLWCEACDRLGLPYDQQHMARSDISRVWDEIDRIRNGGGAA